MLGKPKKDKAIKAPKKAKPAPAKVEPKVKSTTINIKSVGSVLISEGHTLAVIDGNTRTYKAGTKATLTITE